MRRNQLCGDICNKDPKSNVCKFYPFAMRVTKKKFDAKELNNASKA